MKTGVGNKLHFLGWNQVRIWRTVRHTPPKISRSTPTPGKNNRTHLHKKGWALALVLKMRVFGTWKWSTTLSKSTSDNLCWIYSLHLKLWNLMMPHTPLKERICKQWGDIGFQGTDPQTDFRGMGKKILNS